MMKKGFTIIELIVTLIILTVFSLIAVAGILGSSKKQADISYEDLVDKIKSATDVYLSNNKSMLNELNINKAFISIKVIDLINEGLISEDLIDPYSGEMINKEDSIMTTMDNIGLLKFIYPAGATEEFLLAHNKKIKLGEDFNCLEDIDSISLGLIDKDGNLIENYFNNNPDNISCSPDDLDTNITGTFQVEYIYMTNEGKEKKASRNYIIYDGSI